MKLLALMCIESEGDAYVDFLANELFFKGEIIELAHMGLQEGDKTLNFNYTISETYDEPNGKFSLVFGNAAMISCDSVFQDLVTALTKKAEPLKSKDPENYAKVMRIL